MKLNGWKRIGIVASVVWVLGAGILTLTVVQNADINTASSLSIRCEDSPYFRESDLAKCDKLSTDYLAETYRGGWEYAAIVAFVPVPLGWGVLSTWFSFL